MLRWNHQQKVRLGFVRRPGRGTIKTAHTWFFHGLGANKTGPTVFCDIVFTCCMRRALCIGRFVRNLRPGIHWDRATSAHPVKVPKVHSEFPALYSHDLATTPTIAHERRNAVGPVHDRQSFRRFLLHLYNPPRKKPSSQ